MENHPTLPMWPPFFFGAIPTYYHGVLPYAMIIQCESGGILTFLLYHHHKTLKYLIGIIGILPVTCIYLVSKAHTLMHTLYNTNNFVIYYVKPACLFS